MSSSFSKLSHNHATVFLKKLYKIKIFENRRYFSRRGDFFFYFFVLMFTKKDHYPTTDIK